MNGREVIVVFGAAILPDGRPSPALVRRAQAAAAWGRDRDAVFLVTGGIVVAPPAESVLMARLLTEAGIAPARIIQEDQARYTWESVKLCAPILSRLKPARIAICTDDFHLPRCCWLMRLAGFKTTGVAATPARRTLRPILHEIAAIPVDTLSWLFDR